MTQAARFLFDLDFAAPPEPVIEEEIEEIPPEPMITVAEHERLIAAVRQEAFAAGEAKALDDRDKLASEQNLALQKQMLEDISMIYTEVGTLLERLERDASNLAFAFASRFAEKLVAQEPKTEIFALLHQILGPLRQTPHISIRLNEDVAGEMQQEIDRQMSELGFKGELNILPDPAVMPGDCEVEWADGGIGRNLRTAIRSVEQLLEDHFAHIPPDADDDCDPEDESQSTDSTQEHPNEDGASSNLEVETAETMHAAQPEQPEDTTGAADPAAANSSRQQHGAMQ